jgi:hypothetical protein
MFLRRFFGWACLVGTIVCAAAAGWVIRLICISPADYGDQLFVNRVWLAILFVAMTLVYAGEAFVLLRRRSQKSGHGYPVKTVS